MGLMQRPPSQSETAVFGLHLAMAWLPAPLVLIAPVFIRLISINSSAAMPLFVVVLMQIWASQEKAQESSF